MNLSNKLTLSRVFIIPFFVAFLLMENVVGNPRFVAGCRYTALVLFVVAAITDYYDGRLARRRNEVTPFGQLLDPLADKLLTMSAFVAFVELRVPPGRPIFPAWAIILILGREYLVTGLRSIALSRGKLIYADKWGKHKTIWQLVGIIAVLALLCLRDSIIVAGAGPGALDKWLPSIFSIILFVVTTLTAASGIAFVVTNWAVVRESD